MMLLCQLDFIDSKVTQYDMKWYISYISIYTRILPSEYFYSQYCVFWCEYLFFYLSKNVNTVFLLRSFSTQKGSISSSSVFLQVKVRTPVRRWGVTAPPGSICAALRPHISSLVNLHVTTAVMTLNFIPQRLAELQAVNLQTFTAPHQVVKVRAGGLRWSAAASCGLCRRSNVHRRTLLFCRSLVQTETSQHSDFMFPSGWSVKTSAILWHLIRRHHQLTFPSASAVLCVPGWWTLYQMQFRTETLHLRVTSCIGVTWPAADPESVQFTL